MNTSQNFFSKRHVEKYWNPIDLATSQINTTEPYENLSLEDKVSRLENHIEDFKHHYNELNQCKDIFFTRMFKFFKDLEEDKYTYLREFYEESPNYDENTNIISMFNTLAWLSYSDNKKKYILDDDLNDYFSR